jgi:hypothetical protein
MSHHSATATSSAEALATLAIALLVVIVRIRGRELSVRNLTLLPGLLLALGVASIGPQLHTVHLHAIDGAIIAADLALALGIGSVRGFTVLIYPHQGAIWYRYGAATVALWCLSIAARVVLGVVGAHHGAAPVVTGATVLPMLGLTLLAQNTIVWLRRPRGPRPAPSTQPDRDPVRTR